MNCSKCQWKMGFQERVCRRCLYCAELDSYIAIDAPRSGSTGTSKIGFIRHYRERIFVNSVWARRQHELAPALLLLLSLIPGVGHVLCGRKIEGVLTFTVITGLVTFSLFSTIASSEAMPLLGIAFGLHIMSLLRMTSQLDFGLPQKLAINLVFFVILGVLIYGPVADLMLTYKPEFVYERRYNGLQFNPGWSLVASLPYFIAAVLLAWVLGKFLSIVFSLPERKRT